MDYEGRLSRVPCGICKTMFYANPGDTIAGVFVCSYCFPRIKICIGCAGLYKSNKGIKDGACPKCRHTGITDFRSPWQIARFKTFLRDGFTCRYCGRSPLRSPNVRLHCDHLTPRARGGSDDLDNLVTACEDCNEGKGWILLGGMENEIRNRRPFTSYLAGKKVHKVAAFQGDGSKLAHYPLLEQGKFQPQSEALGRAEKDCG